MDQELADAAANAPADTTMAALFCVKWRHDSHLESVTSSLKSDVKLLFEEQSCQISSQSDLKRGNRRLFWRASHQQEQQERQQQHE